MKKALFVVLALLLLSGCSQVGTITEIPMSKVKGKLKNAIEINAGENGNYLLNDGKDDYVFINRMTVHEIEEVIVLKNFKIKNSEDVWTISFDEGSPENPSDVNTTNQLLYKIKDGINEDATVVIECNGEPIDNYHFISF